MYNFNDSAFTGTFRNQFACRTYIEHQHTHTNNKPSIIIKFIHQKLHLCSKKIITSHSNDESN